MTGKKIATFRERITELVESSPKSRTDIAAEFGVAKQTLSAWLTGQNSPRLPVVVALAEYFGVSLQWLNGFDVPKYEENVEVVPDSDLPEDDDFRLFVKDSSQLTPEQFRMARSILRAAFKITNPDLFKEGDDK